MFAGFVARTEDTRLQKYVMFGELEGDADCVRGSGKLVDGVFPGRAKPSVSTLTSGRLQPRTRGDGAGRRNKGWNVSWRN